METFLIIVGSIVVFGAFLVYVYITELRYWLPNKRSKHEHSVEDAKTEAIPQPHSFDGSAHEAD